MEENQAAFHFDFEKIAQELHVRTEILKKLIGSFSNTLQEKLITLEEGLTANDILKMRAILHEVKGTAGNLRLNKIYETADKMHVEVKGEANKEKLTAFLNELKNLSKELTTFVTQG